MDNLANTLRACGETLAAMESANKNESANWKVEFVKSPKLRLGPYMAQLMRAGISEAENAGISAAVAGMDCEAFASLPDTLTDEMQGIVWLGYYSERSAAKWSPEKLKAAFEASGMTQQQLSDATGIAQGRISEHLSGKTTPRPSVLRKYESALGLETGSLE